MPVNTPHPQYEEARRARQLVRDVCTGSAAIKAATEVYLPMPNAKDRSPENIARYDSYLARAVFYEITKTTLINFTGAAFAEDPVFEKDGLDYLASDANGAGISIYQQAQAVLREQLSQDGCGLLVDYPTLERPASVADQENNGIRATISMYALDNIINWRVGKKGNAIRLELVVLQEAITKPKADDRFSLEEIQQWRVLELDEQGYYCVSIHQKSDSGINQVGETFYPANAKGQKWTEIPFQIVRSFANDWTVGQIPLEPIANVNLAHYRNSADYEDSLFICGQVQPVIGGLTESWRDHLEKTGVYIGSRSPLMLPENGSFSFAQAQPNMLAKEGMDNKLEMMKQLGARLIEPGSAAKTATQSNQDTKVQHSILSLCVANLNEAYINCLRWVSEFMGRGDKATFTVKQDFALASIDIQTAQQLYNAALAGKGSFATWWDYIRTGKLPENDYPEELIKIEQESNGDVPI